MAVSDRNIGVCMEVTGGQKCTKGESSWNRCVRDLVEEVQFMVFDAEEKKVLAANGVEGRWRLPSWFAEDAFYKDLGAMRQGAEELFGPQYHFTVLRCVWKGEKYVETDEMEAHLGRSIVVLECEGDITETVGNYEWVSIAEESLYHSERAAMAVMKKELALVNCGEVPEHRVSWARRGWNAKTGNWMRDELKVRGIDLTDEKIVQLRASPWGTVLRACAKSDDIFYLKASPSYMDEGKINSVLSSVAPLHVEALLVVDTEKRVFISSDHGESVRLSTLTESETVQMLKDFATVQKASVNKINALRSAGLQLYTAGWIAEHLNYLLDHEELSYMKETDEMKKLKRKRESIRAALHNLERVSDGLPMCIVHGDLSSGNVYRCKSDPGRFGFFDWDCAFIAHPCFDMIQWHWQERELDSYLEEWASFQSVSKLREALPLISQLEGVFIGFRGLHELLHMEEHCKDDCRFHMRLNLARASLKF